MPVITQQTLANFQIERNSPLSDEQILAKIIDDDINSVEKSEMGDGEDYFKINNDILLEDFRKWTESETGITHIQQDKANNKIPHGFYRLQVLEKIAYLLKNPITISHRNESVINSFVETIGKDFSEIISEWATGATNKGQEWLHVFFDGEDFAYMVIDARQVIPVYDTSRQKKLESVIRYYPIMVNTAGEEKERLRVEWYFPDRVEIYQENSDNEFVFEGTQPHFEIRRGDVVEPGSWEDVPFISLKNNEKCISDLRPIKALIDAYDRLDSEFANDLEDIQEAIIVAAGTSDTPSEIRLNAKKNKVIATSQPANEVEVKHLEINIPHEAKIAWMQKAETNISVFGQSINAHKDTFGNDPSGVALRWLYMPLDLKAGMLEVKLKAALYRFFDFVNRYFEIIGERQVETVDEFEFVFNKSMIANDKEQIQLSNDSRGKISEKTRLEHDPRVEDVEEELKRMKEDQSQNVIPAMPPELVNGN